MARWLRTFSLTVASWWIVVTAHAQVDGLHQVQDATYRFLLRQQTEGRLPNAHLSHQPLSAYAAQAYLDSLHEHRTALNAIDRRLLDRYLGDAPGAGAAFVNERVSWLYRNGQDLFSVEGDGYALQVNPLLYLTLGQARQSARPDRPEQVTTWQNTRGIRASGHIGRYLFFETRLEENQRRVVRPTFVRETAPRLGTIQQGGSEDVQDYWVATGIVGLRTRFVEVRFGRDRNQWGFGRTSLMLSDYAPPFDQLQIRTTFWRLQYVNLFAALTDLSPFPATIPDQLLPKKYTAMHRLTLSLPARVDVELFEAIVFATDTTEAQRRRNFDLAYLNPIIFLQAIQQDRGSPDNGLVGGGLAWGVYPGYRLYTQLLLDELTVGNIGKKRAANKWGWLIGAHATRLGLPGLSAYVEYARLRPYLYSHRSATTAFVHYDDVLGHPAGANAEDLSLFLAYQPTPRVHAAVNAAVTWRGRNTDSLNVGADPLLPYIRDSQAFAPLLQGVRQRTWLLEARVGYELLPHLYLEAALLAESVDDAETGLDRFVLPFVMLRWGLPFQSRRY